MPSKPGCVSSVFRHLVHRSLARLRGGRLTLCENDNQRGTRTWHFGDERSDLHATVRIDDPRFYRRTAMGGGLGAAQSLIDGEWTCDDLVSLVRIFTRNLEVADGLDRGLATLRRTAARLAHWSRRNTPLRARQNIRQHYDLGNDFYAMFLDPTMNYSCGIFPTAEASMEQASIAKMDRICRQLQLNSHDHLLEIGTGWGGLAIHAARHFGCRVTTTTVSDEQFRFARQRIGEAGLEDRIQLLNRDYRDLTGQFSKLVSIEMIEAVGHQFFDCYFRKCGELLREDGLMLLQAIVIADDRYAAHIRGIDFIRRYIFPGGCLPSISVISQVAATAARMRIVQLDDFGPHYVRTLQCWRRAFEGERETLREAGYDESFLRMWHYYLCYCEAGFREHQVNLVQTLLAPVGWRGGEPAPSLSPPTDSRRPGAWAPHWTSPGGVPASRSSVDLTRNLESVEGS